MLKPGISDRRRGRATRAARWPTRTFSGFDGPVCVPVPRGYNWTTASTSFPASDTRSAVTLATYFARPFRSIDCHNARADDREQFKWCPLKHIHWRHPRGMTTLRPSVFFVIFMLQREYEVFTRRIGFTEANSVDARAAGCATRRVLLRLAQEQSPPLHHAVARGHIRLAH